jgi:hypothetical protein
MSAKEVTRTGKLATVYAVKRDERLKDTNVIRDKRANPFQFVGGTQYKGEWRDNYKDGFGVEVNTNGTKYEGDWKGGKHHGKGTLWVYKQKRTIKQYEGEWANGKMEGMGVYYYPNGEIYRGQYAKNMRWGKGKLEYPNSDYYVGEWANDEKNGTGCHFHVNGNVYDGRWLKGMKEGPGRYFYAATRKVYEGEWADNQPFCGQYREPTKEELAKFGVADVRTSSFTIPEIGLQDSRAVLDQATIETRINRSVLRGTTGGMNPIGMSAIDIAQERFNSLDASKNGSIPFSSIGEVLALLGVVLDADDLETMRMQLEIGPQQQFSFPEVYDVANFLASSL